MIHNRRCVSCYNREREVRAGKNARGNTPVKLLERRPRRREFRLIVDGVGRPIRDRGVDVAEPMIQAIRITKGRIAFGWVAPAAFRRAAGL
jgi:hypothetical protein